MRAPFGFGVGDFIAVAKFAQRIINSLSETSGTAAQYASLVRLLTSILNSLSTIMSCLAGSSTCAILRMDDAFRNGICFHVKRCRDLILNFLVSAITYRSKAYFNVVFVSWSRRSTQKVCLMVTVARQKLH